MIFNLITFLRFYINNITIDLGPNFLPYNFSAFMEQLFI